MRFFDVYGNDYRVVEGISEKSSEVGENYIFFAIRGKHSDGAEYIYKAIDRGAKMIVMDRASRYNSKEYLSNVSEDITIYLVDDVREVMCDIARKFYNVDMSQIKFIGVVGTSGKTTTTHILGHMLSKCNIKCGIIGTLGAKVEDKLLYYGRTTPDTIDLYRIISDMTKLGCSTIILEVSVQAIELKKICGIYFEYLIFTNISPEHMDMYSSFEEYANIKMSIINPKYAKNIILNIDDKYGQILYLSNHEALTYGINSPATITASNIHMQATYSTFEINVSNRIYSVLTYLKGKYDVYNIMSALLVCKSLKLLEEGIFSLLSLKEIEGRFEVIPYRQKFVILDFAHTIDSIEKVILTAKELYNMPIIVLLGCTGYSDVEKRNEIGKILNKYCSFSVLTCDNCGTNNVEDICKDISRYISNDKFIVINDRVDAIKYGLKINKGVLMILGKAGEKYQIIGNDYIDYNEREIVLSNLFGGQNE